MGHLELIQENFRLEGEDIIRISTGKSVMGNKPDHHGYIAAPAEGTIPRYAIAGYNMHQEPSTPQKRRLGPTRRSAWRNEGSSISVSVFEYYTTRGMGTVPKFASTSPASAIAWVHQWVANHQERRPMRLLKIVEVLAEPEENTE